MHTFSRTLAPDLISIRFDQDLLFNNDVFNGLMTVNWTISDGVVCLCFSSELSPSLRVRVHSSSSVSRISSGRWEITQTAE